MEYTLSIMKVRGAKVSDAERIYSLINSHAERDRMLFRSMADIYENLQTFTIAELDGNIAGCCALEVVWSDLAEIKSLAVDPKYKRNDLGRPLV